MTDRYGVQAQNLPEENELEIWLPAPGYEDRYEVSSFGRLRRSKSGRIRKIGYDKGGYPTVSLKINNKVHYVYLHRLVCEAFNGPPTPEKNVCDHIDRCIENNYYKNLHWTDYSGNRLNRKEIEKVNISVDKTPIVLLNHQDEFIQRFDSILEANRILGISIQQIQRNVRGRRDPFKIGYFKTEAEYLTFKKNFDKI